MQTDPPVCVLPDDVQEGLKELQNAVGQMGEDIDSLRKTLAEVSKEQKEQIPSLNKLYSDTSKMKDEISSLKGLKGLKQTLTSVSEKQEELISLSWAIIVASVILVILTIGETTILFMKIDSMNKPNFGARITKLLAVLASIITICGFVFYLYKGYTPSPSDQEQSFEATLSPAEEPM